jgi:hypothetical protein
LSRCEPTAFENWLAAHFAATGEFTALAVLVEISERTVTPLRSTFFNVVGDEVSWGDMVRLFAGAGVTWDGAAFFPFTAPGGGALDNATARLKLRTLESRLADDRLVLNEGEFFDASGRRLKIEEVTQ